MNTSMPSSAAATMPGHIKRVLASSDFISDVMESSIDFRGACYTLRTTLLEEVVPDLFMLSEEERKRGAGVAGVPR